MPDQLAYALITPYSLFKSRTGGIIGRLLAASELELMATRMYVLSDEFLDAYQTMVCPAETDPEIARAWHDYVDTGLRRSNPWGYLPRCMLLLFRGENAVGHLKEDIIGAFTEQPVGDTVRGTYGDFFRDESGRVHYFEPAVITCPDAQLNNEHLRLLADYACSDGGVLTGQIRYEQGQPEVSLVILKPENFYRPSRRPGNIIDTFSLTGLRIVGAKLFNMTVAQGKQFYGPLKDIFVEELKFLVADTVDERLRHAFAFPFGRQDADRIADMLAERNAVAEFNKIVEFMTGLHPDKVGQDEGPAASQAKCLALLYEGPNAIRKIRSVLGATDPLKAQPGTVRSDFGLDMMRNGAHASDSPEAALRERHIVGLAETEDTTCDVKEIIDEYLSARK